MGLLITLDVSNKHFLVVGTTPLVHKRKALIESHRGTAVLAETPNIKDLTSLGRPEADNVVDGVFVALKSPSDQTELAPFCEACARLRIPVNVADNPKLCTFSLPALYENGSFQLGISTGGMGCRLASRLKRLVVKSLPPNIGEVCSNIGKLRLQCALNGADTQDTYIFGGNDHSDSSTTESHDDDAEQSTGLNHLVKESSDEVTRERKIRWLSQMVEYFPISKLATITLEDLEVIEPCEKIQEETNGFPDEQTKGRIALVGAGPGRADLLTTEALREITAADLVLADKLVPEDVLALVPRKTDVYIARKFPGNAERAQQELLEKGLHALHKGLHVVRLKQGDPYVYGRGAEEFLFFKEHGFIPKVVAGLSSALTAPLWADIPVTHRGVSDQILICTGTGRHGVLPKAPEWNPSRTTIFLMALHRVKDLVTTLIDAGWDENVPCAAIERASCSDQRVVRSRLCMISEALDSVGSRPPGLLVVGLASGVVSKVEEPWVVEERGT